jgi:hypothetical protein
VDGAVVNTISVEPGVAADAKVALERMLTLPEAVSAAPTSLD